MPRISSRKILRYNKELGESADQFFGPAVVQDRLMGRKDEFKSRYAQFLTDFDSGRMEKILGSFGIDKKRLIVGAAGYSGDMLRSLKRAGYRVAFTDVNREWVKLARGGERITRRGRKEKAAPLKGFTMNLFTPHISDQKISAIISFEPSPVVIQPAKTVLPNLGAKNGLVLVGKTGTKFDPAVKGSWMDKKSALMDLVREYKVQIRHREDKKGGLSFVQFKIPDRKKSRYLFDRECYESVRFRNESVDDIARRFGAPKEEVGQAVNRYMQLMERKFKPYR